MKQINELKKEKPSIININEYDDAINFYWYSFIYKFYKYYIFVKPIIWNTIYFYLIFENLSIVTLSLDW